jgi:hypothetical protein
MASVICDYKTSNGNRTCCGNASGIYGKGSIPLDGALLAVVKAEMVQMVQMVQAEKAEKAEMVQARMVEMVQ